MIDYNRLFDVAYSNTLSEDVKSLIYSNVLGSIGAELNESLQIQQEDSCYVAFLNTLVNSTITEESMYDIIDMSFSHLSEEQIEEITEEFIRKAALERLNEAAPAPIGLTGVAKEYKKQQEAKALKNKPVGLTGVNKAQATSNTPKAKGPSVMDRLKSTVGKVKSWFDNHKQPSGLDKLKANREAQLRQSAELGTSPSPKAVKKTEITPNTSVDAKGKLGVEVKRKPSGVEDFIGGKINNVKAARAEKSHQTSKGVKAANTAKQQAQNAETDAKIKKTKELGDRIHKQVQDDIARMDKDEADRKKAEQKEDKRLRAKLRKDYLKSLEKQAKEAAKQNNKKENKKEKTDSEQLKLDVNTPKAKKTSKKDGKSNSKLNQASTTVAQNTESEKELVSVRPRGRRGRKLKDTNEALADFILTLADTNISESTLEEIVEMIANKEAAKKAIERDKKSYDSALNALNHIEKNALITKVPVDKEELSKLAKKAQEKGERYEKFKALAQKKYGIEC